MLTIFTPTYNRAHFLKRVFDSLLLQNCHDFEWLIIDDGSSDETENVVQAFLSNSSFSVRYIKKENGGKHTAHNTAVKEARGEFILCLDSDDELVPEAVNIVNNCVHNIKEDTVGVIFYKQTKDGKVLSDCIDDLPVNIVGLFELNNVYRKKGEFAFVFRTDVLKQHPFPVFKGEKFLGENVLYDILEQEGWKFLVNPEILEICEYQEEGLSSNYLKIMKNNPAGFCLYFMQRIDMQSNFKNKLIMAGKYKCFCIFAKNQKSKYKGNNQMLVTFATPIGWLFWLYYKFLRGF